MQNFKKMSVKLLNSQSLGITSQTIFYSFSFLADTFVSSCRSGHSKQLLNEQFLFEFDSLTEGTTPLLITRWEDHIPLFVFEIQLSEIVSKHSFSKKIQTKNEEFITLGISVLEKNEVIYRTQPTDEINHYFIIEHLNYVINTTSNLHSANSLSSHYKIQTQSKYYIIPSILEKPKLALELKQKIYLQYWEGESIIGRTKQIELNNIQAKQKMLIYRDNKKTGNIEFQGVWACNVSDYNSYDYTTNSTEVAFYEIELSFEKENHFQNSVLRFEYTNKIIEITNGDINNGKRIKFRKIVKMSVSTSHQIKIIVQKSYIQICAISLCVDQLQNRSKFSHALIDAKNGKSLGAIEFRVEKDANLNLIESNKLWKEINKKKVIYNYLLSISQLSYIMFQQKPVKIKLSLGGTQICADFYRNFSHYNPQNTKPMTEIAATFHIKDEQTLLISLENELSSIEGMCAINIEDFKLGVNACSYKMFKDKSLIGYVSFIANKIPSMRFSQQVTTQMSRSIKIRNLSMNITQITFNSYYETYEYQNKSQISCHVEINKLIKTLILDREDSNLQIASGSDYLNFVIEEPDTIRAKINFLVSDLGFQHQIYGTTSFTIKYYELLTAKSMDFHNLDIVNYTGIHVGNLTFTVKMGDFETQFKNKSVNSQIRSPSLISKIQDRKGVKSNNFNQVTEKYGRIDQGSRRYIPSDQKIKPKSLKTIKQIKKKYNQVLSGKLILPPLKKYHKYDSPVCEIEEKVLQIEDDKLSEAIELLEQQVERNRNNPLKNISERIQKLKKNKQFAKAKVINKKQAQKSNPVSKNKLGMDKEIQKYENKLKGFKSVFKFIKEDISTIQPSFHLEKSLQLKESIA